MKKISKALHYLKDKGLKKSLKRLFEKFIDLFTRRSLNDKKSYIEWIKNNEPTKEELEDQRKFVFKYSPKISLIVPMYNTKEKYFFELVDSVLNQTYSNFELCLADGSPVQNEILKDYIKKDDRIKYKFIGENKGISGNSNEALNMATGDYYALLDHDDIIAPFALFEFVKAINENDKPDFLYSDEDNIAEDINVRFAPHFKSDYAIDTLRSYNYICHFSVFSKKLIDKIGGFDSNFDGSQDYDIILRATENANKVVHIPKILYHWRVNENSVASSSSAKPYAYVAAKKAILESVKRQNEKATIEDMDILGMYRLKYDISKNPFVSIIILNKDHEKDLKKCIDSLEKTKYQNYEILVIENNSTKESTFKYYELLKNDEKVRVITYPYKEEFNYSKINNFATKQAKGDYYLFVNNDIEVLSQDYLEIMVGHALRNTVGAVGAKLLYPDNTVQHAGIVLNFNGVAGHVNAHLRKNESGYFGKAIIQQDLSAVTAAFMMVSKDIFEKVGGFDENLKVAYNDIDLCIKIRNENKLIVFDPFVIAYHYESKTRGYEDTNEKKQRFEKETKYIKEKWNDVLNRNDPYFNINLRTDIPRMSVKSKKVV